MRHRILSDKYSWTIPINVVDFGLAIVHVGPIVISSYAKIGKNCRMHICTNIGNAPICVGTKDGAPIIGNNVAIGANVVVNSSVKEVNYTIAGVPTRKISDNNSKNYIIQYGE